MQQPDIVPNEVRLRAYAEIQSPFHWEVLNNETGELIGIHQIESTTAFLKLFNYEWVVGSNGVWRKI